MAQPKILFYKGVSAPSASTHGIGTLWFDKTNRVLKVRVAVAGTASDWEQYAGKIDDIQLANGIMTIQKADGTNYTINLTDIASAGAVKDALDALDAKISANDTAIKANAAAIATEKQRAEVAEGELDTAVKANAAAISKEAGDRADADGALDAKISALDAAYKAADTALGGRISTLEGQITGLNGTLHFRGVQDEAPANPAQGDFYITTAGVEYIYDGTKWEKIGDTSAESAALSALQGRMDTAEGKISTLEGKMSAAEGKISTLEQGFAGLENRFYTKNEVDQKVADLQGQITSNDGELDALRTRAGQIEAAAETLAGRVTKNEQDIAKKAAQSDLESAVARVAANETAIGQLQTSTSNNAQAISKEAEDRATADATLQGNINTVDGKVGTEKSRAEAAEASLGTEISGVSNRVTAIENTELPGVKNSIKAIEDLKITETYATKTELNTEKSAREAADSALDTRVSACESALTWSGFED